MQLAGIVEMHRWETVVEAVAQRVVRVGAPTAAVRMQVGLHLDDVGPEVGQRLRGRRAGPGGGELQHPDPVERQIVHRRRPRGDRPRRPVDGIERRIAQARRRAPQPPWRFGHEEWASEQALRASIQSLHLLVEAARRELGTAGDVGRVLHRGERHAQPLRLVEPVPFRFGAEARLDQGVDGAALPVAVLLGGEPVVQKCGLLQERHHPHPAVGRPERWDGHYVAVRARQNAGERRPGLRFPPEDRSREGVAQSEGALHADEAVERRDVEHLPTAAPVALPHGDQRAQGEGSPRGEPGDPRPVFERRLLVRPCRPEQAAQGVEDQLASLPSGQRAVRTEVGDVGHDESVASSAQGVRRQGGSLSGRPLGRRDARQEDVGAVQERAQPLQVGTPVDHDAALVGVQPPMQGAVLPRPVGGTGAPACRVAFRALDFHEVGAEIGQQLPAVGERVALPELHNPEPIQRAGDPLRPRGLCYPPRHSATRICTAASQCLLCWPPYPAPRCAPRKCTRSAAWGSSACARSRALASGAGVPCAARRGRPRIRPPA